MKKSNLESQIVDNSVLAKLIYATRFDLDLSKLPTKKIYYTIDYTPVYMDVFSNGLKKEYINIAGNWKLRKVTNGK